MDSTLIERLINISVTLAPNTQTNQPNTFAETNTDTVILSGSRASVRIQNSGNPTNCHADIRVWGMSPSLMNQLSTLGIIWNLIPANLITIQAGDSQSGLSSIFSGQIIDAYGDYSGQPDVPFVFSCNLTAAFQTLSAPITSYPQPFSVESAMASFAKQMSRPFQNSGNVQITLPPMYFSGSIIKQIKQCAGAAQINWGFPNGSALEIWPKTGSRTTPSIPVISATNGMIGYPAFTQNGIVVKTLFNPIYSIGGIVQVQSSLLSALAAAQPSRPSVSPTLPAQQFPTQWVVTKVDLMLDTMLPKGEWMAIIYGYNPGSPAPITPP